MAKTLEKRQFVKTIFINKKETPDNNDKVIIISKDEEGNKYQQVIERPKLTFHVTKKENWDDKIVNFISKDKVETINCPYKNKDAAVVKAINDPALTLFYDNMKSSGNYEDYKKIRDIHLDYRVHGSDINIEDQYIDLFLKKYPTESNYFGLHKAFFDIEVDGELVDGFPDPDKAEAPINIITYVDATKKKCYSFCLEYDHEGYKKVMAKKEEIYNILENRYREKGLDIEFKIFECKSEVELIGMFMFHVNEVFKPDFICA